MPRRVEVGQAVLLEHLLEMSLAKNHHVVEAFAPDAPEEPLARGIHERSTAAHGLVPLQTIKQGVAISAAET